jgi:hypothetical protein
MMLLDDAITDWKPEPGSFADIFGHEKWIKYSIVYVEGYACAGVFDRQARMFQVPRGHNGNHLRGGGNDRVSRVRQQIGHDLL